MSTMVALMPSTTKYPCKCCKNYREGHGGTLFTMLGRKRCRQKTLSWRQARVAASLTDNTTMVNVKVGLMEEGRQSCRGSMVKSGVGERWRRKELKDELWVRYFCNFISWVRVHHLWWTFLVSHSYQHLYVPQKPTRPHLTIDITTVSLCHFTIVTIHFPSSSLPSHQRASLCSLL